MSSSYRTSPADLTGMPPGIPYIVANEAAERFSFYGMRGVLAVFMVQYLHLLDGHVGVGMSEAQSATWVHLFMFAVYSTPLLGALLADVFWGKYRVIIALSVVYCAGHAALAAMGLFGNSWVWLAAGLGLISLGSGGIKPCVSAHVGDQFGERNAHLLPRVFNWFYFSINLGAIISAMLTPWLLEWYGPHWAFGVPGVLMALATLLFWLGRHRFIHVPPGGRMFFREMTTVGWATILKLLPLYAFVAVFWALFDQTTSTWVFQSQDMDRHFLGFEWLPSQLQSLNSVFVLTLIPIFAYLIYPCVEKVWKLTPLRKIGVGLFTTASSFALVASVQSWIDAGQRPNIGWQIIAYALLTASEVMVAIVAMEYAYTQAPKRMKSLVMCLYLAAVGVGNLIVVGVNVFIQIPSASDKQLHQAIGNLPKDWQSDVQNVVLPGYDRELGTADDMLVTLDRGTPISLTLPGQADLEKIAAAIEGEMIQSGAERFPEPTEVQEILAGQIDPWGAAIRYEVLNSRRARLISDGPDRTGSTQWDQGLILEYEPVEQAAQATWMETLRPSAPWLERQQRALGLTADAGDESAEFSGNYARTAFCGGQTRMHGASYFRFFTWLMLGTAVLFVPYAILYRPKTYYQS